MPTYSCAHKPLPVVAVAGAPAAGNSVLERNNHPSRDALFIQPTLSRTAASRLAFDRDFNATFTGVMFASPLTAKDPVPLSR